MQSELFFQYKALMQFACQTDGKVAAFLHLKNSNTRFFDFDIDSKFHQLEPYYIPIKELLISSFLFQDIPHID